MSKLLSVPYNGAFDVAFIKMMGVRELAEVSFPHNNNCCLTARITVGGYMESYGNHDMYSFTHNDNFPYTRQQSV